LAGQQAVQQAEQAQLASQPSRAPPRAATAEHGQLQAVQAQCLAPRQAQAAQQGAGVQAAGGVAAGRQGHGHAGQQHGHQAGHVQVTLGLAQRAADLPVAIAGVEQALVGGQAFSACR
jgi:hypothetical protein